MFKRRYQLKQPKLLKGNWVSPFKAKQAVAEVSVDGGKVRLRSETNKGCYWRDYKAVRLQGMYYGAFFGDNQSLIDYVNSQPLTSRLSKLA